MHVGLIVHDAIRQIHDCNILWHIVCGQDCPDGEEDDFRLVQCRDYFDGIPINETLYTWMPYFPGNTCIQMTELRVVCILIAAVGC